MTVPCTYLRSSSATQWESCQLSCYINHCLGVRYPSGPAAHAGSITHEVLEILANCKKIQQEDCYDVNETGEPVGETKYYYQHSRSTYLHRGFNNVNEIDVDKLIQDVYELHIQDINPARVPKTYQRKTPEASVRAWIPLKKIQTSINNLLTMKPRSFDPRGMDVYATEHKFDVEVKEPWSKYHFTFKNKEYKGNLRLKGSIDLITRLPDGTFEILDWKSGVSDNLATGEKKTYEDYASDLQLGLYWLVCRKYLGLDVSHITVIFMNEQSCYTLFFDDELVMNRIKFIFEEMKSCTLPKKTTCENYCFRYCPYFKNSFDDVKTKPLVRAREYNWVNEVGLNVVKKYKICGQTSLYFNQANEQGRQLYSPLEIMESIARIEHNLDEYVNT